jgi:peptide/nickel transport system substrate-binding protein
MTGIENGFHRSIPLLVLITLLFSAGGGLPPTLTEAPQPTITPLSAITPPPSPRALTICIGQEPNTLYPFGNLDAAAQSVLAATDTGPIDTVGYAYQPVILQKLPSIGSA